MSKDPFIVPVNPGLFCNKLIVCTTYSILSVKYNRPISFCNYGQDYLPYLFEFLDEEKLDIVETSLSDWQSIPQEVLNLGCKNTEYLQCSGNAKLISENLHLVFKDEVINQEPIDGIFVHMRLGDIDQKYRPDRDYYDLALQQIPNYQNMKRYVTSSELHSKTVWSFAKEFDFEIYEGGREETLKFGSRFTNKILSQGTYSWFIGTLGSNNNIIYPAFYEDKIWHDPTFYEPTGWNCLYYRN